MKGILKLAICLVAGIVLSGCSSHYLVNRPMVLPPCGSGQDARATSTAALIKALEGKRWTIEGLNADAGLVRAKVCRGRSYCMSIDATVDQRGEIKILRTPRQHISRKGGKLLQRWTRNLHAAYMKYRCPPPETVRQILGQGYPPFAPIKGEEPKKEEKPAPTEKTEKPS